MTKLRRLEDIAELVHSGDSVALGGAWFSNHPMAAIRQLIRDGINDLHLIETMGSIDVELLVAARALKSLTFSMVSMETFGLAPRFRAAAQSGDLELREMTGCTLQFAIDAAARNVPFQPIVSLGGSDIPTAQPSFYSTVRDPFTGEEVEVVKAIAPDVAIIHVTRCDASGNAQTDATIATDPELARAAKTVIVTCEEIVDRDVIAADPHRTIIPGFLVDAVIEAPFGAHPTSHIPRYAYDAWEIRDYMREPSADQAEAYVSRLRGESEADYLERTVPKRRQKVLGVLADRAEENS
ncbi:CoA transferase subunit A [Actinomycetes bacterium M1A6_2h]